MPEVHLSSLCTELGTIWCRRADREEDYDSVDSRVPGGIRPGKKVTQVLFHEVTCSLNKLSDSNWAQMLTIHKDVFVIIVTF